MYDVVVLGSATIDLFLTIEKKLKSVSYGEKVLVEHIEEHTGGGGTNSAVALARLGTKVAYLGKLGKDNNANTIKKELRKEKIRIIKVKPSNKRTSNSVILKSEKETDRIIYVYKGASDELTTKDVPKFKTKWIYLATLLGKSFKTAEHVARYAKKNKIKILFNPSTYLAKQGKKKLKTILEATSILILNKQEAQQLLKTKINDPLKLAKKCTDQGPTIGIVTDGTKGVYASDSKHLYKVKPFKVKVTHTAGAGDAFASGFLAAHIKGANMTAALHIGMANAANVIQAYGTKNKLLNWQEAISFIRKHHGLKIKKKIAKN